MVKLNLSIKLLFGLSSVPGALSGYCNWGPLGTGASSVCDGEVQGGTWCNDSASNCQSGCGGKWCTNDGGDPQSSTSTSSTITNGEVGYATTTRYWDCSGGACGCSYIPTGGTNDDVAHCHSNAMFQAPADNIHNAKFYGSAAISASLGGGDWLAEGCGKCWKVTGTSNIQGTPEYGDEVTLVLKGTNFCPDGNPMCGAGPHFDIAAAGFDVLAYSFAHTCPEREPEEAEGFASCGNWLITNSDPYDNCNCSLFKSDTLRMGCENFYSLKWDNPTVSYVEVDCPPELSSLHCSYPYALEESMPETCERNDFGVVTTSTSTSSTTTSTTPATTTTSTTQTTSPETTTSVTTTEVTTTEATTTTPATTTAETTTTSTTTTPATTTTTTTTTPATTTTTTSTSGGSACCSWDYASCGDSEWCNANESQCTGCGGKAWMEPNPNCIPLNGECTDDIGGCCNPLGTVRCKGNRWYRQCQE